MNQQSFYTLAELNRCFAALVLFGVVVEVDSTNKLLKVQEGNLTTGWLPWPAETGRNYRRWRPMKKGQQLVVLCRSGDPAQGVIVGELYSDSNESPSTDDDIDLIQFINGNKIEHNAVTGQIHIIAKGDVHVTGDVIADGISLKKHVHKDTMPGSGKTGVPQ